MDSDESDSDFDIGPEEWGDEYFKDGDEPDALMDEIETFTDIDHAARLAAEVAWSGSAARKVLGNTEMLEKVLERVHDMRTLLLAQQVNSKFRDVISKGKSKQIRRTLWLEPDPLLINATAGTHINPLMLKRPHAVGFSDLKKLGSKDRTQTSIFAPIALRGMSATLSSTQRLKDLLSKPGSWKKMMLFQPKPFFEPNPLEQEGPWIWYRHDRGTIERITDGIDWKKPMSLEYIMQEAVRDKAKYKLYPWL